MRSQQIDEKSTIRIVSNKQMRFEVESFMLRKIPKNSSARREDDSDEKMLLSLSKMYINSMINSLSLLKREKKINKITDDLDDSRSFSQQMIASTLKRSNSSEHHRLSEEFIVCFFYHNHRRIIHIRSFVNKSLSLVSKNFFLLIFNYLSSFHSCEHFKEFS
jgi:hypothetical protein